MKLIVKFKIRFLAASVFRDTYVIKLIIKFLMKAISILVLLTLAAFASATKVATTPYDGVYAWFFNMLTNQLTVLAFTHCLLMTNFASFLWGDGGFGFYFCL